MCYGLETFKLDTYDLCALDVILPKMVGFESTTITHKENSEIPILFLTAKSLKADKIEGLKLGGDDYITKAFRVSFYKLKFS